jgi:hypothetical protein
MKTKRLISLLLTFAMLVGIAVPAMVTAADEDDNNIVVTWSINQPRDATVTQIGLDNHLLRFALNLSAEETAALAAGGAGGSLKIDWLSGMNSGGSSRRFTMWTDLCGTPEEVNDITFATAENRGEGKLVQSLVESPGNATSTSINVPQRFLYDAENNRAATAVFFIINIHNNVANTSENNRGGGSQNEFERVGSATLNINIEEACECGTCLDCRAPTAAEIVASWSFGAISEDLLPATGSGVEGATTLAATGGVNAAGASFNRAAAHFHANAVAGNIPSGMVRGPAGSVSTYGWLHNPDNFYYLKLDTRGFEHLMITFDIERGSSTSAPSLIIVQTSEDKETWRTVRNSLAELAPSASDPSLPPVSKQIYLHNYIEDKEEVYVRWFYGTANGQPAPPGTSAGTSLGRAHGTSGWLNLYNVRIISNRVNPDPECFCGSCSQCVHIFPFPIDAPRAQIWAPNVQEGWEDTQFDSPTGDAVTAADRRGERTAADLRYLVFEFDSVPSPWRFTIQNDSWRRYDIDFPAGLEKDNDGNDVQGREQKLLPNGGVRYVLDLETAMPAVENMGNWTSERGEHLRSHPGYRRGVCHGQFQMLLHARPEPLKAADAPQFEPDWEQTLEDLLGMITNAYLTNVHPDKHVVLPETMVHTWEAPTTNSNPLPSANTSAVPGVHIGNHLKFYFNYQANNVDAVRAQYSFDGTIWNNMNSAISIFDTSTAPAKTTSTFGEFDAFLILPAETYNKPGVQIRFVKHGPADQWTTWGASTFTVTNAILVSGLQAGERARRPSPVLSIGAVANPVTQLAQRASNEIPLTDPEISIRPDAVDTADGSVQWNSLDTDQARVINGVIRGMNAGNAIIRVSSIDDLSIYTEFTVNITAGTPNPNINYTITSPYAHVNWETYRQFKAAHHIHTTDSDGAASTAEVAERHYKLGFDIVAITNHNRINLSPDRPSTGRGSSTNAGPIVPMTTQRVNEMHNGVGRDGNGMIFIPGTNEQSSLVVDDIRFMSTGHHVNTYWANSIDTGSNARIGALLSELREKGTGLGRLNHLGRNTGSLYPETLENAIAIAHNPANFLPYVDILRNPFITGMEIINKFDTESQADRVLWDNMLSILMPEGIPIYGYSDDDSHFQIAIGFSYNRMLMPELTLGELRHSMESGAFLAFSRVDRQYGIYAGPIQPTNWEGNDFNVQSAKDLPEPKVHSITVNNELDTITIDASIYRAANITTNPTVIDNSANNYINWYADGIKIHTGKTLDLRAHQLNIYGYVRASIVTPHGVLYTQPFGVQIAGQERQLAIFEGFDDSVLNPVSIPSGSARTELGFRLPGGLPVFTNEGARPSTIIWDLDNLTTVNEDGETVPFTYNPNINTQQQFTVHGKIRLLQGVNGIRVIDTCTAEACSTGCLSICTFKPPSLDVSIMIITDEYVCKSCSPRLETAWKSDFTGDRGTAANVGGNLGIQLGDLTNSRAEFIDGALHLTNTAAGGNRPIRIHTNAAAGGSFGWSAIKLECDAPACVANEGGCAEGCTFTPILAPTGFHAEQGVVYMVKYTLALSAPAEGASARMQIRVGNDAAAFSANTPELSTTPQVVSHTWEHNGNHSVNIDTGNIPENISLIISDITISKVFPCDKNSDCTPRCENRTCNECALCKEPRTPCRMHPEQSNPCPYCVDILCSGINPEGGIEGTHERTEMPCGICLGINCPLHKNAVIEDGKCGVCEGTHCPTHPNRELVNGVCLTCNPPPRCQTHPNVILDANGNCHLCNPPPPPFVVGRILPPTAGQAADRPPLITDALEILKHLAGLPNTLVVKSNERAWEAAKIMPASITADKPSINDVLEILKFLANIPGANYIRTPAPRT